jgi:hypothetical protein
MVGVTFDELWARFLARTRHVDESTHTLYAGYGRNHLLPFFEGTDIGLILRTKALRAADAPAGAVYVDDDWVTGMLAKERRNNAGRPIAGALLSMKFVDNVLTVLGQCFDLAVTERPALLEVNPAKEIRLPKHDRREMHFLDDAATYATLRGAMTVHFQPLLDVQFADVIAAGIQRSTLRVDLQHADQLLAGAADDRSAASADRSAAAADRAAAAGDRDDARTSRRSAAAYRAADEPGVQEH